MPNEEFTILVRLPNWLGDCVMALPALRHLAETLPGAKILLAGREAFGGLLSGQPGVAGFVEAPKSGLGNLLKSLCRPRSAAGENRLGAKPDIGLLLTNSLSTAAWMWRVGAKARIGYNLDGRRFFLTHPVPCGGVERSWHFVHYYLWLAKSAESVAAESGYAGRREVEPTAAFLLPSLGVSDAARERAAGILRQAGVGGPYAVLAPTSAYGLVKDWPPGHYRTLIEALDRDFSLPAILTGGRGQSGTSAAIASGQRSAVDLTGQTSLEEFAALLAGAALFVGGDSGGAHMAAALGIPTLVIFGVTNPSRTRPTGAKVREIGGGQERDRKLDAPEAREEARTVLAGIMPETALTAVGELLESGRR